MDNKRLGCAVIATVVGAAAPALAGPTIGVTADVGVPDGGVASVEVHPIPAIAVSAGVSHNLVSTGFRGGVAFVPFHRHAFSPIAQVAYGHYPEGDANPIMATVLSDPELSSPLLERVGYDFADLHLGFEVGSRHVRFYLQGGMSRVTGTIHGIDQLAADAGDGTTSITLTSEPTVDAWIVSAKLGLAVYL